MENKLSAFFIFLCLFFSVQTAFPATVLERTRLIVESSNNITTLRIMSRDSQPVLIQSWVDSGNSESQPGDDDSPFLVTPPVARLNPGASQSLAVRVTDNHQLPQNQESMFWLNVLEIPVKNQTGPNENIFQAAFKTRIKLFYRPHTVNKPVSATDAICLSGGSLVNKSPNYYSVTDIRFLKPDNKNGSISSVDIIAPYKNVSLGNIGSVDSALLSWIDDDGLFKTDRLLKC